LFRLPDFFQVVAAEHPAMEADEILAARGTQPRARFLQIKLRE
jgi:hypothetical protein